MYQNNNPCGAVTALHDGWMDEWMAEQATCSNELIKTVRFAAKATRTRLA